MYQVETAVHQFKMYCRLSLISFDYAVSVKSLLCNDYNCGEHILTLHSIASLALFSILFSRYLSVGFQGRNVDALSFLLRSSVTAG